MNIHNTVLRASYLLENITSNDDDIDQIIENCSELNSLLENANSYAQNSEI